MLDHLGINVSDYARSRSFYATALAPLGVELLMEPAPEIGGFGRSSGEGAGKPFFWISTRATASSDVHVAFGTDSHEAVDAFHAAALEAGAADNGPPGPRPVYHEHYYGAFVLDPDGNNVEAVCHRPAG